VGGENVGPARRWFEEVWNRRRTGTIDESLTDQSISYSESGPLRGGAGPGRSGNFAGTGRSRWAVPS
jgi:hypothetical protein